MIEKLTRKQRRERAKQIYLEAGGVISFADLARNVGSSAKSVSKWKAEDHWNAELAKFTTGVKDRLETALIDSVEHCFKNDLRQIHALSEQIDRRLKKELSINEIKALASAKAELVRHGDS